MKKLNIEETLDLLPKFHSKPGLDRIRRFCRDNAVKLNSYTIIVGGTNGKGSVSAMLENLLLCQGISAGVLNSPHVYKANERLRIEGRLIDDETFSQILSFVTSYFKKRSIEATLADVTTACALLFFSKYYSPKVLILEVGMGGRLDPVNIAPRNISIITNIGRDHTAILGSYPYGIAKAKGGIIKEGAPLVTGEEKPAVLRIFKNICRKRNTLMINAESQVDLIDSHGTHFTAEGEKYLTGLAGYSQGQNGAVCLKAVEIMRKDGFMITPEGVKQGFVKAQLPWRMERFSRKPLIYFDGSHNREGWRNLQKTLSFFNGGSLHIVLFLRTGKFIEDFPVKFHNKNTTLYLPHMRDSHYKDPYKSAKRLKNFAGEIVVCRNLEKALVKVCQACQDEGMMVVTGSLGKAGETLEILNRYKTVFEE